MNKRTILKFKSASAQLQIGEDGDQAKVTRVYASQRGQGHGSGLLTVIEQFADERGMSLWLEVEPYKKVAHEILDLEQLVSFYQRHGFEMRKQSLNAKPVVMVRQSREINTPYSERANSTEIAS